MYVMDGCGYLPDGRAFENGLHHGWSWSYSGMQRTRTSILLDHLMLLRLVPMPRSNEGGLVANEGTRLGCI